MFKFKLAFCLSATVGSFGFVIDSALAAPVGTGLVVRLDGSAGSLGSVEPGNPLARWFDLASDANPNSFQDFVQGIEARQPTVSSEPFPNSSTHNVVSFIRGSTTGSQNSNSNSDRMVSVMDGSSANTDGGADAAYNFATGMSLFVVFKSNLTTAGANASSRQSIIRGDYDIADPDSGVPGAYDRWVLTTSEDNTVGPSTTTPDLFSQFRDSATEDAHADVILGDITDQWYIFAASWDMISGTLERKYVRADLATLMKSDTGATRPTGLPGHTGTFLGARNNSTGTSAFALDGAIAELLIYNAALGSTDYDANVAYLTEKYFVSAPQQAGDFDGDGDVDGADFVAWQTNFPKAENATLAEGDADGDGDVDGADFVVWQTNFPFTPSPGASAVPEPHTWLLLLPAVLVVVARLRHCALVCRS